MTGIFVEFSHNDDWITFLRQYFLSYLIVKYDFSSITSRSTPVKIFFLKLVWKHSYKSFTFVTVYAQVSKTSIR